MRELDKTPNKIFRFYWRRSVDKLYLDCRIEYNDQSGIRHFTSFRLRIGESSEGEMPQLAFQLLESVKNDSAEDLDALKKYITSKPLHKKIDKNNRRHIAEDIVQKFCVVRWYFKLAGFYELAKENALSHIEHDNFEKLQVEYETLYNEAWTKFYEFMTPYTRKFIDEKLIETKRKLLHGRPIKGGGYSEAQRQLGDSRMDIEECIRDGSNKIRGARDSILLGTQDGDEGIQSENQECDE